MGVTALATTAIKGLRMEARTELMLAREGVRENRRFYLVDARDRMVNGKQVGALTAVLADYCHDDRTLTLTFPGGDIVSAEVQAGETIRVGFYSRPRSATLVLGPFSRALSDYAGQPLRLVQADQPAGAVDRGGAGAVSLISRASLAALAAVAGREGVDGRRFRMLIEVDGVGAHEEDRWVGHRARIGAALVYFEGHVGRCLVTSRHPQSGEVDLPTLDLLRSYRSATDATEPLPFGIYGRVLEPGLVALGDPVAASLD